MDLVIVSAGSDPSVSINNPLGDFDSGTSDVEADYEPIITAPGNDADDPLDTVIAGCVFPVDEFQQVSDGLNRHQSWTVYPGRLGKCLQAAIDITSTGDIAAEKRCAPEPTASGRGRAGTTPVRVPPLASDVARLASLPRVFSSPARSLPSIPHAIPAVPRSSAQLYRDLIPNTLEKCITYDDLNDWPDRIQRDILHASARLAELVARKLAPAALARTDDEDAEEDILCLLQALAWTATRTPRSITSTSWTPPEIRPRQGGRRRRSSGPARKSYSAPSFASSTRRRRRCGADGRTTTATATMG